jgi:hypothetical protein
MEPSGMNKNETVIFRAPAGFKEMLSELAQREQVSISAYLRHLVMLDAARRLKTNSVLVAAAR